MGLTLTQQLLHLHAHGAAPAPVQGDGSGGWSLRMDHVVLGRPAAALALTAFESLGAPRFQNELTLACGDGDPGRPPIEPVAEASLIAAVARRRGAYVARSGAGPVDRVYRARFGAPGKLLGLVGEPRSSAGALGMLSLPCDALESACVLAGGPLYVPRTGVLGVWLRGAFARWVSGQDLTLEVIRRLPPGRARGMVVEFAGPGVSGLSMSDRIAVASSGAELDAPAVVFPSDETTRRFLKGHGREADWKLLEAADDARYDETLKIDLNTIEPLLAPLDDPGRARAVRQAAGAAVCRVVIGSGATWADLARLARALNGRPVQRGTELLIAPGGRPPLPGTAAAQVLDRLVAAGARLLEGARLPDRGAASSLEGSGLCFGARREQLSGPQTPWYVAGPDTCAAAALTGRITDPGGLDAEHLRDEDAERYPLDDDAVMKPIAEAEAGGNGAISRLPPLPAARPLDGPLRGTVLARLGDDVGTEHILPWGARMEPLVADVAALAEHAFAVLDRDFARRARVHGGGFVVAGAQFGIGEPREQAALAPMCLGVRAVLAHSFDPDFRRQLVNAGVLPLLLGSPGDGHAIARGDELEIPGLPEALEPGKPLVVRDLTRGNQYALLHELEPREIAVVRAGGLLPHGARLASAPPG